MQITILIAMLFPGNPPRESSSGNPALQQQLIAHGISCIQPGLLYFQEKLGSDTVHPVAAFKAARLFSPTELIEIQPEAADIDTLNNIPFLSQDLNHLKEELPTYFAKLQLLPHLRVAWSP